MLNKDAVLGIMNNKEVVSNRAEINSYTVLKNNGNTVAAVDRDSVPGNTKIENITGKSSIINLLKNYYHTDIVLDLNKNAINKYSSLRQGCAFAAFLADASLYDIDEKICQGNNET